VAHATKLVAGRGLAETALGRARRESAGGQRAEPGGPSRADSAAHGAGAGGPPQR
jgi:hypothetical protein